MFNANRVIPRKRPAYAPDVPDRQYIVLKRRFAAFDTSPVPLPLSFNGNGNSFLGEDSSNTLMSDGMRRVPSTGSLDSIDQNMPDGDFTAFQADGHGFCDDDDDLQLTSAFLFLFKVSNHYLKLEIC